MFQKSNSKTAEATRVLIFNNIANKIHRITIQRKINVIMIKD